MGFIDLHSHTNESDGTFTPAELIDEAIRVNLDALAITDHDTFAGYDIAKPIARQRGFDLVCGIELSTKFFHERPWTIHLLGYFPQQPPTAEFRSWLNGILSDRKDRNLRLIENLKRAGVDIELREVEALGRSLTGRPHFARLLVQKGYASSPDEAFRRYLVETAPAYADRKSPETAEAIQRVRQGGGITSLAHPGRLGILNEATEATVIRELAQAGLQALEVQHSDHQEQDVQRYRKIASELKLLKTGGSDYHGAAKPKVKLGAGIRENVRVPRAVLDQLRNQH